MYGDDEEKKYKRDIKKLEDIVEKCPKCIGISVHFEIYPKGKVQKIFEEYKRNAKNGYSIDVKKLGKNDIHILRFAIAKT